MRLLVTGCAGFIGSNFVRYYLRAALPRQHHRPGQADPTPAIALTWPTPTTTRASASSKPTLLIATRSAPLTEEVDCGHQLCGPSRTWTALAARSGRLHPHQRRGAARAARGRRAQAGVQRFLQVSTDEVYGHVPDGLADERAPLAPRNPYSASKGRRRPFGAVVLAQSRAAGGAHSRGANTIGPHQYPEKVTPLFVTNALDDRAAADLRPRDGRARLPLRGRPSLCSDCARRSTHGGRRRGLQRRGERGSEYRRAGDDASSTCSASRRR